MKKILAWDMYGKRYVGDVNEKGDWFKFAIIIEKHRNKTYDVRVWVNDHIDEDEVTEFLEPTYQELKLYSEKLLEEDLRGLESRK